MGYIQITGKLQTPLMAYAVGVGIRFTATNSKESVKSLVAEHTTIEEGVYDFPLVYGTHTLAIKEDDTYVDVGEYTITDMTPNPITLPALIAYATPVVPPIVVEGNPIWEALFSGLTVSSDTVVAEDREQLVGDSGSVLSLKESVDNTLLERYQLKDTNLIGTDAVNVDQHVEVYTDGDNNKATTATVEHNLDGVSLSRVNSIRKASDGDTIVSTICNKDTSNTTYTETNETVDSELVTECSHSTTESIGATTRTVTTMLNGSEEATDTISISSSNGDITHTKTITDNGVTIAEEGVVGDSSHSKSVHTYADGSSGTVTTLIAGSKATSVTHTNDGTTTELDVEVDSFNVGSTLEVDDINHTVTVNGSFKLLGDTYKGATGDTVTEVYEYSVTGSEDTWHTTFATGDIYRRTGVSTNGVIDALTWTEGTKLAAVDGADGDTIFFVYQYSEDGATDWHTTLGDDDVYRRDAISTNGLLGSWSAAGKISGVDGVDGYLLIIEYQYSADGVTVWHSNFTTGDHYRRERLLKYASDTTLPITPDDSPVETGAWSSVGKVVPVKGDDYFDGADGLNGSAGIAGNDSYFHIAYASDSVGTGFTQTYTTDLLFMGTYVDNTAADSTDPDAYTWLLIQGAQGATGDQGIPGTNGANGLTSYLHIAYADDLAGGGFSQDGTDKPYMGVYVDFVLLDSTDWNDYAWSLIQGIQGVQGNHGSGSYTVTTVAEVDIPNDAGKDAHLLTLANRAAQAGDILTYTDTAKSFSSQFLRGVTTWSAFTLAVDGDAIINGTLAAEKLIAGTITGDYIAAGAITAEKITLIASDVGADTVGSSAAVQEYTDNNFVTSSVYGTAIAELQEQVDGNITSWFMSGVPTIYTAPANSWDAAEKNQHLGDVYYDDDTGYAYRYRITEMVYSWGRITDSDVTEAIQAASTAQDTADGKRRVFVITPYAPYDVGDLWVSDFGIQSCKTERVSGYLSTEWSIASDITDYAVAATNANSADKTDGTIGGWQMDTNYIWSGDKKTSNGYSTSGITLYKAGGMRTPQFYIDASSGNAHFKGTLEAASGTFAGDISAASGHFAGTISAESIDSDIVAMVLKAQTELNLSMSGLGTYTSTIISGNVGATTLTGTRQLSIPALKGITFSVSDTGGAPGTQYVRAKVTLQYYTPTTGTVDVEEYIIYDPSSVLSATLTPDFSDFVIPITNATGSSYQVRLKMEIYYGTDNSTLIWKVPAKSLRLFLVKETDSLT